MRKHYTNISAKGKEEKRPRAAFPPPPSRPGYEAKYGGALLGMRYWAWGKGYPRIHVLYKIFHTKIGSSDITKSV